METDKTDSNKEVGNLAFVKEVAKYFMDFLETDFHKRKNPKRSIKLRSSDNLLVGINLSKYPAFTKDVWALVNKSFQKEELRTLQKGVYKTALPKNLLDLVKLQVSKITSSEVDDVLSLIAEDLEKEAVVYKKEYDKAISVSLENATLVIKEKLVLPFIGAIEKSIENLELGDENDVYIMEEELTDILVRLLESKLSEILKNLIAEETVNITKQLKTVFGKGEVKANITSFFDSFQVGDLFSEFFEVERNRAILDKQEFYLYFCDITFNKTKYPIFYIPFDIKRDKDVFEINFDSQVYINKRALEFIVQEFNVQNGTRGNLRSVTDRIIYLSQHQNDLSEYLSTILSEIVNVFGLDKNIVLTNSQPQVAKSLFARVSNSAYLSLFDKSDEALVNDYEEILQQLNSSEGILAEVFDILVQDFIHKNPEPVNPEVEREWDNSDVPEKLVCNSPIPLNSEQLQILSAMRKEKCKYLIVEGPPGTGKSHTITAIIFDAILRHQSVLVLSDKKEALDVVEDKITETMNKVRFNEHDFRNPILRLGKTGNNYSQILAKATLEKIKAHHRAVQKDYGNITETISKLQNSLKEDIEAEIFAYSDVELNEIHEYYDLEAYYEKNELVFDINELSTNLDSFNYLERLRIFQQSLHDRINSDVLTHALDISIEDIKTLKDFKEYLAFVSSVSGNLIAVAERYELKLPSVFRLGQVSDKDLPLLKDFIKHYEEARVPVFGYLFSKTKVEELNQSFRNAFPFAKYTDIQNSITDIKSAIEVLEHLVAIRKLNSHLMAISSDYLGLLSKLLLDKNTLIRSKENAQEIKECLTESEEGFDLCLKSFKKLGITEEFSSWLDNKLTSMTDMEFERSVRYAGLKNTITSRFGEIPRFNYASQKTNIETLITTQVTHLLDSRLIDFYENNKSDAATLRDIIKDKKQFPKEQFAKLKDAFPCILAGIRDFAEFIPLESGLFDLVIIDEASQVSIAQAFPALIRAKKVLILGDKKQFSNVKASQARSETNREYLNALAEVFKQNISKEDSKLIKLSKFDIKTSILDFFESISNYNIQLLKYFRGYKEIISYSNKHFYQNSLQVMKIRGKNVEEVLKFTFVEDDGKTEATQNTNKNEILAIISELQALRDADKNLSIGIITPHTNQQKLLMEEISKLPERDYYFDKLNLKIMTFDTCQGEERDIIFYSMVATESADRLWGVFIKDLNNVDSEEDGKIKVQRLNVGFSRAKEQMHFILSKSLDKFNGSIGDALRHYYNTLEEAKKEKTSEDVDQNSPMEKEVLNWFYQTDFWAKNKHNAEFIPQFEIGKYLKQLDITYKHPNYKVDFLLVYHDEQHKEHKIIIEYDGFKEHFQNIDEVNEFNYVHYYSENDVYREKVLESYGYKFLRINKFNIGSNPIKNLDERISSLLRSGKETSPFLDSIHETYEGLQNGDKKECPKCKEIRETADFKDTTLIRGYGRFCRFCKSQSLASSISRPAPILSNVNCPRCSSKMILRNGSKGKFYGCSRFPRCRGTKNI